MAYLSFIYGLLLLGCLLHCGHSVSSVRPKHKQGQVLPQDGLHPDGSMPKGRIMKTQANAPVDILLIEDAYTTYANRDYILGNPIVVSDDALPNCSDISVSLTLVNGFGKLYFWPGHQAADYYEGAASIWVIGTLYQVNWALANVRYTPPVDFIGSDIITVLASDHGSCSTNISEVVFEAVVNITLTILPNVAGDAVLSLPPYNGSQSAYIRSMENQNLSLTFALRDPFVASTAMLYLNFSVVNGKLYFPNAYAGPNLTWLATGPTSYQVMGTLSNLRSLVLSMVTFTPPLYFHSDYRKPGLGLQQLSLLYVQISNSPAGVKTGTNYYTVYLNISSDPTTCPCFTMSNLNVTEDSGPNPWNIVLFDPEYNFLDQMNVWLTVRMTLSQGTLSFPTTSVKVTYTQSNNTWTLFGTESSLIKMLNGTMFTPAPDFVGIATLQIYVQDDTKTGSLLQAFRNHTQYATVLVTPVNDAPRILKSPMYSFDRDGYLTITNAKVVDPDAVSSADIMSIQLEVYLGTLQLSRDPADFGIQYKGDWTNISSGISFNATLDNLNALLNGMQYWTSIASVDYIDHITDPVHSIGWIKLVINDNGAWGAGGPKVGIGYLNITAYAELFPTCQHFVDLHTQYCGCYYVTQPAGVRNNSFPTVFSNLPMDFPMKLYLTETAHRGFAQGCCQLYAPQDRPMHLTRRYQVGMCNTTQVFSDIYYPIY